METIRAILLDFGGTLDSNGLHWSTQYAQSFEKAGVPVPRERLDKAFLTSDKMFARRKDIINLDFASHIRAQLQIILFLLKMNPEEIEEKILDQFLNAARYHFEKNSRLLQSYLGRFRFALVSNFTENLHRIVEEVGLGRVLEIVICSESVGLRKPDPQIFELALTRLNANPEEAAVVGDSLCSDIMPAKALGLTTIWIKGDRIYGEGDESAADYLVDDLEGALSICESLRQRASEGQGS